VKNVLAYLFWHTPKPTVAIADYERDLLAFSRSLSGLNCPGVKQISSFRTSAVPWLDGSSGYEDWITIDGSSALETLNEQAVSGRMAAPHGAVAQQMGAGYGGVYYHLSGDVDPHLAERAQWLSRPRGIEFRPVLKAISNTATGPVSVWRRFMVLGPGLEFVVLGDASLALQIPDGWSAHPVTRTVVG
jgi:hypothetical protein